MNLIYLIRENIFQEALESDHGQAAKCNVSEIEIVHPSAIAFVKEFHLSSRLMVECEDNPSRECIMQLYAANPPKRLNCLRDSCRKWCVYHVWHVPARRMLVRMVADKIGLKLISVLGHTAAFLSILPKTWLRHEACRPAKLWWLFKTELRSFRFEPKGSHIGNFVSSIGKLRLPLCSVTSSPSHVQPLTGLHGRKPPVSSFKSRTRMNAAKAATQGVSHTYGVSLKPSHR